MLVTRFEDGTHPLSLSFRHFVLLKDGKFFLPSTTAEFCDRGIQRVILRKILFQDRWIVYFFKTVAKWLGLWRHSFRVNDDAIMPRYH